MNSFVASLTKNVGGFTLFEEFSEEFDSVWEGEMIRTPSLELAVALSQLKNLRSLSASFAVDAEHFFLSLPPEIGSGEPWEKLTYLSLTARQLRPGASYHEAEELLLRAAAAARYMPSLRTMELWYGRRDEAFVFRYSVVDRRAEIACAGTWSLALQPWVVKEWARVSGRELRVGPARVFCSSLVKSHGDAIYHLGLRVEVVHPRSLTQMRREQKT